MCISISIYFAFVDLMNLQIISKFRKMIQDLTISYVCNGIETTLTIKDDHYDNMPYNLADMFVKVIRESDVNALIVVESLKNTFENEEI